MTLGSPRPAVAPSTMAASMAAVASRPGVGLIDHAAHEVALRDVRGLVREHARRARSRWWIARNKPLLIMMNPPGIAKALIAVIAHHGVIELVLSLLGMAREAVAELLDVVGDLGVLEHEPLRAHLPRP